MFKKKQPLADLAVVERQIFNLTKLVNINSMINSTLDMGRLMTVIMETIKDIMETEASTLLLYEEKENDLVFKVALGEAGKELTERYRVRLGQGIAGWVAETRKPIFINNVYEDRRFDPEFDKITGFTTRSIICTPLLFKGKLLGVIQAINPIDRPGFTEEDMNLFKVFAEQASLAVQNAIFFQNALEEERIKSELTSARTIQEALIPDVNMRLGPITITAKSVTAREIGGEFHGIFRLDGDHIGIALGDLHVKGVPGGLHASIVSGAIRALAKIKGKNPVELVRLLHLIMEHDERPVRNASLLYGVLDLPESKLRFLNAGVAYPILVRDGVARYLRFGKRSLGQNIEEAKSVAVSLMAGDLFVVVSDGILRIKNRMGKHLGLKSVMRFLERGFDPSEDIIESILGFARDFADELGIREDISVIVLRVD
ncbi:MAG TPA: GAF domain-containing protein [Spirochaetota bacterium]|nr:GAF domain-containing protein [Spirochaetota bacterium]HPC40542.1 GAF domain-containing protein [Spirochaetota bacterium]HPL17527.1 GAF domain-containing protein [Spirochaetota bacterium]HQF07950.1 GAF domain-containing protein [Spirochaetota bacterium]HQH96510.1 GAF domain-containing protein [Spirochaetota bacterium]